MGVQLLGEARGEAREQRREREAADAAFKVEQKRLQEVRRQSQSQESQLDEMHTVSCSFPSASCPATCLP